MATLRHSFRCLKDIRRPSPAQWVAPAKGVAAATRVYRLKTTPDGRRSLSTSPRRAADLDGMKTSAEASFAALEAAAAQQSSDIPVYHARPVPISPSYFSRYPIFYESYVVVQDLARKYDRLPLLPKDKVPPTAWKTKAQYRLGVGEEVKGKDFAECMKLAKHLNRIHPDLMPDDVKAGLAPFKRAINFHLNKAKVAPLDKHGRSHGAGRRKSSVARAWIVEGTGEVLVNGKPLNEAFGRVYDRESAVWGLKVTQRLDKFNVWALVEGGGTTGQAEALALATSKALMVHEPALKSTLRKAGCLTRDHRTVERKKPGHVKARKMPAWVKR